MVKKNLWKGGFCILMTVILIIPVTVVMQKVDSATGGNTGSDFVPIDEKNILYAKATASNVGNDGMNLLPNPSFEQGDEKTGTVFYWKGLPENDDSNNYFWGSNHSHSGNKAVCAIKVKNNPQMPCWGLDYKYDVIPVTPSDHFYHASFWYKIRVPNPDLNYDFFIILYDVCEDGYINEIKVYELRYPDIHFDGEWHQFSVNCSDFLRDKNSKYISIYFASRCKINDEIWFDDVFFGPINADENFPPLKPLLYGDYTVKYKKTYKLQVSLYDPNNDKMNLIVDWGDGTNKTYGPFESDSTIELSHTYAKLKDIGEEKIIKAKVVDENGLESEWSTKYIRIKMCKEKISDFISNPTSSSKIFKVFIDRIFNLLYFS